MENDKTELSQIELDFQNFVDEFEEKSRSFSFFQLVFLLENYVAKADPKKPNIQAVGEITLTENKRILDEYIRFRPYATLAYPKADVESLEYLDKKKYIEKDIFSGFEKDVQGVPEKKNYRNVKSPHFRMELNFLGLYGVSSPLPSFYTEAIINIDELEDDYQKTDGSPRRDFFDVFGHRFYSLLYQVWRKYRYYIRYSTGEINKEDAFSEQLFSLIGLGDPAIRKNSTIQWIRLLPYAGLLTMRQRSANIMQKIISHYFSVIFKRKLKVVVEECVFRWVTIDASQRSCFKKKSTMKIGESFVIGSRVKDYEGKFRVHLESLTFDEFASFLPDGQYYPALIELINFLLLDPLDFDLRLTLQKSEIPPWQLGGSKQCRLGWSNWSKNRQTDGVVTLAVL